MKYILSDLSVTLDKSKAIADFYKMNLSIHEDAVPGVTMGTEHYSNNLDKESYLVEIRSQINNLNSRCHNLFGDVDVELLSLVPTTNSIAITLSIDDKSYVITKLL